MFGAVESTKNADFDKYKFSRYSIGPSDILINKLQVTSYKLISLPIVLLYE